MGSEAVVNIAHGGGLTELTLRDGITLELVAVGGTDNWIGAEVKWVLGKFSGIGEKVASKFCGWNKIVCFKLQTWEDTPLYRAPHNVTHGNLT